MKFGQVFGLGLSLLMIFSTLPARSSTASEPVCVSRAGTKLRSGPGKNFKVSWAVPKFMPLLQTGKKGSWLKVKDLEGETHWVSESAVSHKIYCAVVRTKTAKLRSGPGYDQPPAGLSSVDKYTPFEKVDRDGEWVQVKDDYAATYWVHETNIWIPMGKSKISF